MNKIEDLVKEIAPAKEERPKTYTAEVSHTDEEGIVWVRLPGAEQDTPTASTSSEVKMGDTVTVEWRNNKLYIAGNYTNPSAGVTRVSKVEQTAEKAMSDAETAQAAAESAQETANAAITIAGDTDQHFWFTETGTDTGAHITEATQEDFLADPSNGGGNLLARSNGIAVRDGLAELATFSASGAQIGQTGQSHLKMDYHSLQLKDKEDPPNTYFYVSDLRDKNGEYETSENLTSNGGYMLRVALSCVRVTSLTVNGDDWLDKVDRIVDIQYESGAYIYLTQTVPSDATITIKYVTTSHLAKTYILGIKNSDASYGVMSVSEGLGTNASGLYSHAEGEKTNAGGIGAHAEGYMTSASGANSHAEGWASYARDGMSHAEGWQSHADGQASHAEGYGTEAVGDFSHAQNSHTIAGYDYQTAIGKYNENKQNNAFEIGNGSSSARSNAFEVDWNGNTTAAGNLTVGGHSSPIGDIRVRGMESDTVVHTATGTALCALTLPAGTWSLVAYVRFPSNNTGVRRANISTDRASNALQMQLSPTQGGVTQFQVCHVVTVTATTTYYLNVYHTAGVDLTLPAGTSEGYINGIRAVRIA